MVNYILRKKISLFLVDFIRRFCLVTIFKIGCFKEYLLTVFYWFHLFLFGLFKKIIIQIYKMIKNKVLYIKVIFKVYFKTYKIS